MLADRHYMRTPEYGNRWSMTTILLVANICFFVLQSLVVFYTRFPIQEYFYLSGDGVKNLFLWQFITFQFLHSGLGHLLSNCLCLFFAGRPVEQSIGGRRMLQLYLLSGVVGGIFQVLLGLVFPRYFGGALVGASAGTAGLVGAFCFLFWDQTITFFLYFIPISIRGQTLFWIMLGLSLFGVIVPNSGIAHAAHLGGLLTGIGLIRRGFSAQDPLFNLEFLRRRRREPAVVASARRSAWAEPKAIEPEEVPAGEFISREVDPILDKISSKGIHSLTERERQILEKARARMAKR